LKGTFHINFNSSFISDLSNDDTVSVTINIVISSMGKGKKRKEIKIIGKKMERSKTLEEGSNKENKNKRKNKKKQKTEKNLKAREEHCCFFFQMC